MARRREVVYSLPQIDYDPTKQFVDFSDFIIDSDFDFISNSFLPDIGFLNNSDHRTEWMYRTKADIAFLDTSLGGSIAINMPYQHTSFSDLPRQGRNIDNVEFAKNRFNNNVGVGRYYHESIIEHSEPRTLIMEFGVPKHRSMFSFFTEAVSFRESVIAKEGRSPFLFDLGRKAGIAIGVLMFPTVGPIIYLAEAGAQMFFGDADPRYYSFKPSMPNYIGAANGIFKSLMIERGLLRIEFGKADADKSFDEYGMKAKVNASLLQQLEETLPAIFNRDHQIDLFRIVARPQLLANRQANIERSLMLNNDGTINETSLNGLPESTIKDYMARMFKINSFKNTVSETGRKLIENQNVPTSSVNIYPSKYKVPNKETGAKKRLPHDKTTYLEDTKDMANVVRKMGFDSVAFYVDYVGSSTYTFSNETKDIPAKGVLNSVGSASRDVEFSLSGGNILGDAVDSVIKGARDVIAGTLETATFGLSNVFASLAGGGYISFPKMWSDSSVTLPTHSFKVTLGGPYGNALSKVMDIDAPLSLLLPAVLPLSVGRASYTSPFLCRAFLRGIMDIDFGMVTNMSITAGTGVLGRDKNGIPLQIEVTFTITDFNDIVAAKIPDSIKSAYDIEVDEYTTINKLMKLIGGRSYRSSRYVGKSFSYRLTALESDIGTLFDPAKLAALASDTTVADLFTIGNVDKRATSLFSH